MTMAINEMMIQSHEAHINLFPVWPRSIYPRPAEFSSLRTKEAFLVCARFDPANGVGPIAVTSTVGGVFVFHGPWGKRQPKAIESATGAQVDHVHFMHFNLT